MTSAIAMLEAPAEPGARMPDRPSEEKRSAIEVASGSADAALSPVLAFAIGAVVSAPRR
ncbi:hypothetical protein [Aureimonas jatrophae]|uniref:hypothetical protein n=1 Tax=Aureimonas jatrophae TaxID=1166073 RepID=UPI00147D95C0|nr:hypothetical protein [Aureimonas jatrophae]MBB3950339.1 hypothetical protein [Aureimonas jatrophae]